MGSLSSFDCIVSNAAGSATSVVWSVSVIPAPTAPYPRAVLALRPVGYWRLNEAERGGGDNGVIAQDYAGGNNGIYTNVLLGQASYNPTTDRAQTSARFGYLAVNNSCACGISGPDFSLPNGASAEFTVAAWANPTGANGLNTQRLRPKATTIRRVCAGCGRAQWFVPV